MERKRVIIHGRVQGVGFRYSVHQEATRLGVAGYAKNLLDGTVEVEIEAQSDVIKRMLRWLAESPGSSRVETIEVIERDPLGSTDFRVG